MLFDRLIWGSGLMLNADSLTPDDVLFLRFILEEHVAKFQINQFPLFKFRNFILNHGIMQ